MQTLKKNLYSQIATILAQQILSGQLQPGDQLAGTDEICEQYNISRTVVREAVKLLTAKGLIDSRPRVGMIVRPRSDWSLLDPDVINWRVKTGFDFNFFTDLIGMRRVVEPGAAELAASLATDEEIAKIQAAFDGLESNIKNTESFVQADVRFHSSIIRASHNELVQQLSMTVEVAILAITKCTAIVPGSREEAMPVHKAVVDAITARDPRAANETMRVLLEGTQETIDKFINMSDAEKSPVFERAAYEIGIILDRE